MKVYHFSLRLNTKVYWGPKTTYKKFLRKKYLNLSHDTWLKNYIFLEIEKSKVYPETETTLIYF